MSVQSARNFLTRMTEDEEFREKFISLTEKQDRLKLLEKEGYYFTEDECRLATKPVEGELSDEDLDRVSGGGATPTGNGWSMPGQQTPCGW